MTPEVKEGLFQLFNQGDNSMTRRFGGTGSGLLRCKRLLDLMSGELHYESESGKGTTFSVSLQLDVGDATAFGANQTQETRTNQFLAQMAPLLAKENPDALMLWHDNRDWLRPAHGATFEAFEKAICLFEFGVARKLLSNIAGELLH